MDIMARIKNTTVESLAGVPSHFDDLPRGHFAAAKDTNMIRIVAGADDLVHPLAGRTSANAGMVKIPTDAELSTDTNHNGDTCNNPRCCPVAVGSARDARSAGQIEIMDSLIEQLGELDHETSVAALTYTDKMTLHGAWTPGRDGNASRWIGNMIAKVRELRAVAKADPKDNGDAKFQDIPDGNYAVADTGPDDIHFFRVSRFRDGGIKVQERAGDELHPVRRGGRRTAILTTIQTVGWRTSMELYGRTIGSCGRCHRTLTDAVSRGRGIGPDCWEKM